MGGRSLSNSKRRVHARGSEEVKRGVWAALRDRYKRGQNKTLINDARMNERGFTRPVPDAERMPNRFVFALVSTSRTIRLEEHAPYTQHIITKAVPQLSGYCIILGRNREHRYQGMSKRAC